MFRKNLTSFLQENGKLFNCDFYINIFTAWPKNDSVFKEPVLMNGDNILKLFGNLDVVQITYYRGKENEDGHSHTTIYLKLVY